MRAIIVIAAGLAACAAAGCVESRNPPFGPSDLVFEPALIGEWVAVAAPPAAGEAPPAPFRVEAAPDTAYRRAGAPADTGDHRFFLFRLGDRYFAAEPTEAGYRVARVTVSGDRLKVWGLDAGEVLGDRPAAARHTPAFGLTGPTAEVRAFLAEHADDPGVWLPLPEVYRRTGGLAVTQRGLTSGRQRTVDYWAELRAVLQGPQVRVGGPGFRAAREWEAVARHVAGMPTAGVDPAAAGCGPAAVALCEAVAGHTRARRRPADPLAALVREAGGGSASDPSTVPPGRAEVQDLARDTLAQLAAAAKALSVKYGCEFPPIR